MKLSEIQTKIQNTLDIKFKELSDQYKDNELPPGTSSMITNEIAATLNDLNPLYNYTSVGK